MGASKLLKEKRPKIFWTSCAAHTINLMLEGIAKQSRFKKFINQAKALTIFLYAHHKVLALMRTHTQKRDIVRLGVTRFASSYLTLQSLNDKKVELKMMFGSKDWEQCNFLKTSKGKDAYCTVMSLAFCNGVSNCLQVFTPLIKVLRIADCDKKSSMSFIYGELLQAKEDIKVALNNVPKNFEPIIEVIDGKMKDRLDSPLHRMAYLLNPYYYYKNRSIQFDEKVNNSVCECIDVLYRDYSDLPDKIFMEELPIYKNKESNFRKPFAERACASNSATFDPVNWWSNFGGVTPNLTKLAMRLLSLTSSSSGCERNWSAFEGIHTKKRNRLRATLLNDLVFIQFNARLLSKQKRELGKGDMDVLSSHDAATAQEWIVDGLQGDEDGDDDDEAKGENASTPLKYRMVRELYDEFESEDEEATENEMDEGGTLEG